MYIIYIIALFHFQVPSWHLFAVLNDYCVPIIDKWNFKWYAFHQILFLVRGSVRVPFVFVRSIDYMIGCMIPVAGIER